MPSGFNSSIFSISASISKVDGSVKELCEALERLAEVMDPRREDARKAVDEALKTLMHVNNFEHVIEVHGKVMEMFDTYESGSRGGSPIYVCHYPVYLSRVVIEAHCFENMHDNCVKALLEKLDGIPTVFDYPGQVGQEETLAAEASESAAATVTDTEEGESGGESEEAPGGQDGGEVEVEEDTTSDAPPPAKRVRYVSRVTAGWNYKSAKTEKAVKRSPCEVCNSGDNMQRCIGYECGAARCVTCEGQRKEAFVCSACDATTTFHPIVFTVKESSKAAFHRSGIQGIKITDAGKRSALIFKRNPVTMKLFNFKFSENQPGHVKKCCTTRYAVIYTKYTDTGAATNKAVVMHESFIANRGEDDRTGKPCGKAKSILDAKVEGVEWPSEPIDLTKHYGYEANEIAKQNLKQSSILSKMAWYDVIET